MRIVFRLLFLLIFALGCQENKSKLGVEWNSSEVDQFSSEEELSNQLNRWKVQCLDEKKCPDSVAQLLVTDGKNLSQCTATLIAEDVVLSNSHCFDMRNPRTQRLIDPDHLCRAGSRIVFAENSLSGHAQVKCKKILKKSFLSVNYQYPDYVVFQIDKPANRKFDEVSRAGLQDQLKLQIRKVNPVRRGLGQVEVLDCLVLHQTLLAPRAITDHYHIHTVTGCKVVGGNSGSSLVDDSGFIRGVIFKGISENSRTPRTEFEIDFRQKALKLKSSLMTNATCIDYKFNQNSVYEESKCLSYQMIEDTIEDALSIDKMKQKYSEDILETAKTYPSIQSLGYQLRVDPVTKEFIYSPFCIKPIEEGEFSQYIPNSMTLTFENLFWRPKISVSSLLKAEVSDFKLYSQKCQITYSPAQFKNQNQGLVQFSGTGCKPVTNQSETRHEIWSICQK